MPTHLFVYGTLRRKYLGETQRALLKHTSFVSEGTVPGQRFALGSYFALVPSPGDDVVAGEVLSISPPHLQATLDALDEYEGVSDPGRPSDYRRDIVTVRIADRTIEAWSYVLNRPPEGLTRA